MRRQRKDCEGDTHFFHCEVFRLYCTALTQSALIIDLINYCIRSLGITPNYREKEKEKEKDRRHKDPGSLGTKGDESHDYYYQEADEDFSD